MATVEKGNKMKNKVPFWISFADKEGPKGVIIVQATDPIEAINRVNFLKINPGGEAKIMPVRATEAALFPLEKLITLAELEEAGYVRSKKDRGNETRICKDCNEGRAHTH